MALSPTSSHGGGTFNGGTITQPLVIDLSGGSGNDVPLKVLASYNAQNVDFFEVTNSDVNGLTALGVDSSAKVYVKGRDTTHAGILDVKDASQGTGLNLHGDAAVLATSGYATAVVPPGALPTVALVSGAAAQISTARDVCLVVPFTGDGTNNAATLKIELSQDGVTFSTLDTLSIAAALNLTGALNTPVSFVVPDGWYVKLTAVHGAIGTATYY